MEGEWEDHNLIDVNLNELPAHLRFLAFEDSDRVARATLTRYGKLKLPQLAFGYEN